MPPRPRPRLRSQRDASVSETAADPVKRGGVEHDFVTDPIEDDSGISEYESQHRGRRTSRVKLDRSYEKQSDSSARNSRQSLATSTTLGEQEDPSGYEKVRRSKANNDTTRHPSSEREFDAGSDDDHHTPSRYVRIHQARDSSLSTRNRPYKQQGLTQRSSVTPDRCSDKIGEEEDATVERNDGPLSRSSRNTPRGRKLHGYSGNDSETGLSSSRNKTSRDEHEISPSRARKAYLSPPPTVRHPPKTPGVSSGRASRRLARPSPTPSRRSHKREHEVYDIDSSDGEPEVRVKRTTRRKLPSSGEVLNITTDDEMPSRITSSRKLEFTRDDSHDGMDVEPEDGATVRTSDEEDAEGNLRGFVVPDEDGASVGSPSKRRRQDIVESSRSSRPSRVLDDPFAIDSEGDSKDKGGDLRREREPNVKMSRNVISAKGNDGAGVDIHYKSSSGKRKAAARSPSRDSDTYQPSSKRTGRPPKKSTKLDSESEIDVRGRTEKKKRPPPSRDNYRQELNDVPRKTGPRFESSPRPLSRSQADSKKADRRVTREEEAGPASKGESGFTRGSRDEGKSLVKPSVKSPVKPSVHPGSTGSSRPLVADDKCRVTREEDQEGFLVNSYGDCVAYLSPTLLKTPQETGAVGVSHLNSSYNGLPLFDAENISVKRLSALITLKECAGGMIVNPARADPAFCSTTTYTTGNNVTLHNLAKSGENVDLVIFAFVAQEGSSLNSLTCPSGPNAPLNRGYHALNVYPLNGEYQRTLAFMHQVLAPVKQECQMYTNGNAWQATSLWGDVDKYQGRKPLPQHVRVNAGQGSANRGSRGVHPALSRFAKNYMADIPVFDSRRHFLESHVPENWREGFSPANILSQVDSPDERFQGEIPDDSLVAMHSVVSMRANGSVSLNLIGVQVLVTPRGVFHSDLVSGRAA